MSFIRSLPALFLLSLLAGAGLLAWAAARNPAGLGGGYAVLITGAELPDRALRELLAPCESAFGGPPVSESSQWALLDEFDSLAKIPLDEYPRRVASFDPRNDGYAEKLRSFFMRDGQRFVFIPLKPGDPAAVERRLAAALGDIPFSLEYLYAGKPPHLLALLYAAALAGLFLFCPGLPPWIVCLLPVLPVLLPLALYGAPGFVLCALLTGLSVLLWEPLFEWFMERRYRRQVSGPFRRRWLFVPFFLAAYAGIAFRPGSIFPPAALVFFAACAAIYVLSVRVFSLRGVSRGHIRFAPVLIVKSPIRVDFSLAGKPLAAALPFILAAAAAALAPGVPSGRASAFAGLVTEAEYQAHADFQASFSLRPLGRNSAGGQDSSARDSLGGFGYAAYESDADGLINPSVLSVPVPQAEIPPFPLKSLMDFLNHSPQF